MVNIGKADQVVTASDVTATYNGQSHSITGTTSGDGAITYINNGQKNKDVYTVTINAAETTNYKPASTTAVLTINALPITITADSKERDYNGSPLTCTTYKVTTGALATGDLIVSAQTTGAQTTVGTGSNTISNAVIKNQNGAGAPVTDNYTITYAAGTLKVNKATAALTITSTSASLGKTYHKQPVNTPVYSYIGDGAVTFTYWKVEANGDEPFLTGVPVNAGTYKVQASAAEGTNYNAAISEKVEFTISPQAVTITAANATSTQGAPLATLQAAITAGQIYEGDNLGISVQTTANSASAPNTYPITISYDTTNSNYHVTPVNGTYTITSQSLPYSASGYAGTYDGNNHSISVTTTNSAAKIYYGTEALTEANYLTAGDATNPQYKNAGNYKVYYYVRVNEHTAVAGFETVSINQKDLIVSVPEQHIVYGEAPDLTKVSFSPFANNETQADLTGSLSVACSYSQYGTIGTFDLTPSGYMSTNYNIIFEKGSLVVAAKPVSITWPTEDIFAADGNVHTMTVTSVGGTVNGDVLDVASYEGNSATAEGSYEAKVVTLNGDKAGNYTLVGATGVTKNWSIGKAINDWTVQPAMDGWTYGATQSTPVGTSKYGTVEFTYSNSETSGFTNTKPSTVGTWYMKAYVPEKTNFYAAIERVVSFEITKATQNAPTGLSAQNVTVAGQADGQITGVKVGMEYKKSGESTYTTVTPEMQTTGITGLENGTYLIRFKDDANHYAGVDAQVTVGCDIELKMTLPAFSKVTAGYAQPEAKAITLESVGQGLAVVQIANVTSSNTSSFTLEGSDTTVPAGSSLSTYTIRPAAGLAAGSYQTTITVTYDSGAQVTGTIHFVVEAAPATPAPDQGTSDSETDSNTDATSPTSRPTALATPALAEPVAESNPPERPVPTANVSRTPAQEAPDQEEAGSEESTAQNETNQEETSEGSEAEEQLGSEMVFRRGNIIVRIQSAEEETKKIEALLPDIDHVINVCLTEEEKQTAEEGDIIEIRLTILKKDQEVPPEEQELVEAQIEELSETIPGLNLGQYLDIKLDKRFNDGDWIGIPETPADLEIVINIPEELQFPDTQYFISRVHNGETQLLYDLDQEEKTITISTRYFSTYAILYTEKLSTELGQCYWHWAILLVFIICLILVIVLKEEKRKKIRIGILIVEGVLVIVFAVLGSCVLDWPMAIGSMAITVIVNGVRGRKKNEQEAK